MVEGLLYWGSAGLTCKKLLIIIFILLVCSISIYATQSVQIQRAGDHLELNEHLSDILETIDESDAEALKSYTVSNAKGMTEVAQVLRLNWGTGRSTDDMNRAKVMHTMDNDDNIGVFLWFEGGEEAFLYEMEFLDGLTSDIDANGSLSDFIGVSLFILGRYFEIIEANFSTDGVLALRLRRASDTIMFQDEDPVGSSVDGVVEVNDEHIEDAVVNIDYSNTTDELTINKIEYLLYTNGLGGEPYIAAGQGLREKMDEPEGMLVDEWDFRYEGLSDPGVADIEVKAGSDDQYKLSFTNTQGIDYSNIKLAYGNASGIYHGEDDKALVFGVADSDSANASNYVVREDDYFVLTHNGEQDTGVTRILRFNSVDDGNDLVQLTDVGTGESITAQYTANCGLALDNCTGSISVGGSTFSFYVYDAGAGDYRMLVDLENSNHLDGTSGALEATIVTNGGGIIDLGDAGTGYRPANVFIDMSLRTLEKNFDTPAGDEVIEWNITGTTDLNLDVDQSTVSLFSPDTDDNLNIGMSNYGVLIREQDEDNDPNTLTIEYPLAQLLPQVFVTFPSFCNDSSQIQRSGYHLELYEYLGDVVETLGSSDAEALKSFTVSNDKGTTDVNQYLRLDWGSAADEQANARVVYTKDEDDNFSDFLWFKDGDRAFLYEMEFLDGLTSDIDANGSLSDFMGVSLFILGRYFEIIEANFSTDGVLALRLRRASDTIMFQDEDPVGSSVDGVVEVNDEHIEDAVVNIDYSNTTDELTINKIEYLLYTNGLGGEPYIAAGQGLREKMDEPEGMLVDEWDFRYEGLSDPGVNEIEIKAGSDDQYKLSFTNTQGIDYSNIRLAYGNASGIYHGEDDKALVFGVADSDSANASNYVVREDDYFVVTHNGEQDTGVTRVLRFNSVDDGNELVQLTDVGTGGSITAQYTANCGLALDNCTGSISVGGYTYSFYVYDAAAEDYRMLVDFTDSNALTGGALEAKVVTVGGGILDLGAPGTGYRPINAAINMSLTTLEKNFDTLAGNETIEWNITGTTDLDLDVDTSIVSLFSPDTDDNLNIGMSDYGVIVREEDEDNDPNTLRFEYPMAQLLPQVFVTFPLTCLADSEDPDNDSIIVSEDNCPDVSNPTQTDSDNDGVGDACEITPMDEEEQSSGSPKRGSGGGGGRGAVDTTGASQSMPSYSAPEVSSGSSGNPAIAVVRPSENTGNGTVRTHVTGNSAKEAGRAFENIIKRQSFTKNNPDTGAIKKLLSNIIEYVTDVAKDSDVFGPVLSLLIVILGLLGYFGINRSLK